MSIPGDRRVIACNFAEGTNSVAEGALAYVTLTNSGSGHDRICVYARSRSGRWIEIWQDMRRLSNFRWKTIPPPHPLYGHSRIADYFEDKTLSELQAAKARVSA